MANDKDGSTARDDLDRIPLTRGHVCRSKISTKLQYDYLHSDRYTYLDYIEAEFDFVTTEEIGQSGEGRPMRVAKICRCNFGAHWCWA